MTHEDRTEWLVIAAPLVSEIPEDLLAEACRHAQCVCDHPAKIVPAIIAHAETSLSLRRRARQAILDARRDRALSKPDAVRWLPTPDELAEIKAQAARHLTNPDRLGD